MENGRRRRHLLGPAQSEVGNLAIFVVVLALLAVVAFVIYTGVSASFPLG